MESELGGLPINDNDSYVLATEAEIQDDNRNAYGVSKSYRKTPYASRYFSNNFISDSPSNPGGYSGDDHKVGLQDLFARLLSDPGTGLTQAQVAAHTELYGTNELAKNLKVPEWVKITKHLFGGCTIFLWGGALLSFVSYSVQTGLSGNPGTANISLGICLVLAVCITAGFSYFQERNYASIAYEYQKAIPTVARVLRNGTEQEIAAEEIVLGDIILVEAGEIVPADARVLSCSGSFMVDNSQITGESEPQERDITVTHDNILLTKNMIFCSSYAVQGHCKAVVTRTGVATTLGQMADIAESSNLSESGLNKEISNFVEFIVAIGVGFAVFIFMISLLKGFIWGHALFLFICILLAVIPEGLLATVSLVLSVGAKRLYSRNLFVKNVAAIESLGSTSIILTDKTGTLTKNEGRVAHVWFNNEFGEIDTSVTYRPGVTFNRLSPTWTAIIRTAVLGSRAEFTSNSTDREIDVIGSPIEAALLRCVESIEGDSQELRSRSQKVAEIPFNSVIKFQLSIHETADSPSKGFLLTTFGDPQVILNRCSSILWDNREIPIDEGVKAAYFEAIAKLGSLGERIVALADYRLPLSKYPLGYKFSNQVNFPLSGFRLLGLMSMMDTPRPSVPDSIAKCQASGIKIIMVTGDNGHTAKAVAQSVGILSEDEDPQENVVLTSKGSERSCLLSGDEMDSLTDEELGSILVYYDEIIFCSMTGEQKLSLVEQCQSMGAIVAVTGDGANDAPALRKANVGIAMGISGSQVAKEVADVVLLDDDFGSIVSGIEEGRIIFDNLKKSIFYTLCSSIPQLGAFLFFFIADVPMPLAPLSVLVVDLVANILPALSLAYETEEEPNNAVRRGPRHPIHDQVICEPLLYASGIQIGILQTVAGFFTYFVIMAENGFWPSTLLGLRMGWDSKAINDLSDAYLQEWTYAERKNLQFACQAGFVFSIVLCQWITLIASRTKYLSVFQKGMKNWTLNFALFFETFVILLLIYIPGLNKGVGLSSMPFSAIFTTIPFMICIFVYDEVRKAILRKNSDGFLKEETIF